MAKRLFESQNGLSDSKRSIRSSISERDPSEAGNTFYNSHKIDMRQLVSVGNMSISPSSRDVVLASRDGLFIIDLDNPLRVPQFLPQGGIWEIADVQWNPHPSWSEYIISTSSEKLLVWNLMQTSRTYIQYTLQSHYRAITDINWHNFTPSRVASCGIDSWIWMWDLRSAKPTSKLKPTTGLSAFNQTATQVKWNRRNQHLLASSHSDEVLIWDERKGSVPLNTIKAHDAKIYGIDWSRHNEYEITSCSLDKSIKSWDTSKISANPQPLNTISVGYPIWRARTLPFGRGVLAQPHRGLYKLDMYRFGDSETPVHTFEGLTGVVKEFVWRTRGGDDPAHDDREFQLITWDNDCVLRYWPLDLSTLQKVGFVRDAPISIPLLRRNAPKFSYRDELEHRSSNQGAITAPTHHSGVLESVKATHAPVPPRHASGPYSAAIGSSSPVALINKLPKAIGTDPFKFGTMTMGKGYGKSVRTDVDQLLWLASVDEGGKREGSIDSAHASSTRESSTQGGNSDSLKRKRAKSRRSASRGLETDIETEVPTSLKSEITLVASKFSTYKVKIDGINLKSSVRSCAVGVDIPSGIFLKILFKFPDTYPGEGRPAIDIDRNRNISIRKRAYILRELRRICSRSTLCIEPCVRYLLGLPALEGNYKPFSLDFDSEEDDVQIEEPTDVIDEGATAKIQQNQPPRERTSQAVFSMNGTLVRIVTSDANRNMQGVSPPRADAVTTGKPSYRRGNLPSALRGLARMAKDVPAMLDGDPEAEEETYDFEDSFSTQPGVKHTGILGPLWDRGVTIKSRTKVRPSVVMQEISDLDSFDRLLASKFVYSAGDPYEFCSVNAEISAKHGRYDYHRLLDTLGMLFKNRMQHSEGEEKSFHWNNGAVATSIEAIYSVLCSRRNSQMLAMVSIAILLGERLARNQPAPSARPATPPRVERQLSTSAMTTDYFSLRPRIEPPREPSPQPAPTPPTVTLAPEPGRSSPVASPSVRTGSWQSLLYPRLLISGVSDNSSGSYRGRGSDPPTPASESVPGSIPVPGNGRLTRINPRSPRNRRLRSELSMTAFPSGSAGSGHASSLSNSNSPRLLTTGRTRQPSSSTPTQNHRVTITFAAVGLPKRYLTSALPQDRWRRDGPSPVKVAGYGLHKVKSESTRGPTPQHLLLQYIQHVRVYSELLFRAGLLVSRAEVLHLLPNVQASDIKDPEVRWDLKPLVVQRLCRCCSNPVEPDPSNLRDVCIVCLKDVSKPDCTVCHLPVKGLSRTCLLCCHTSHLKCWDERKSPLCATGCGCKCPTNSGFAVRRASLAPATTTSITSMFHHRII